MKSKTVLIIMSVLVLLIVASSMEARVTRSVDDYLAVQHNTTVNDVAVTSTAATMTAWGGVSICVTIYNHTASAGDVFVKFHSAVDSGDATSADSRRVQPGQYRNFRFYATTFSVITATTATIDYEVEQEQ